MSNQPVTEGVTVSQLLGHYRILEKVGSGGMGEVYRARDERLEREVAIKVLPRGVFVDESARSRLRKEALALSRLNHPNIATVHDFGSENGTDFLVMEYVPGANLRQRLAHGELSEKEVIRLGTQIAHALEEAHDHGVVHHDLKPGNILVSPKGVVKVLDFGVAEMLDPGSATMETATKFVPSTGGTMAYMAPEILKGRKADARSDIWSMGVVLYEMLTRQVPFKAASSLELVSTILRDEPEPLPPNVSPVLRTIVGKCLAKDPGQRYQHAGEIRASLEVLVSDSSILTLPVAEAPWHKWLLPAGVAAAIVMVAAVAAVMIWQRRAQRSNIGPGGQLNLLFSSEGEIEKPVISPDGKMVAFVAEENGQFTLFVSRVAGGARLRLTNDTSTESSPTFSPDGDRIAFARRRPGDKQTEICIIPTLGGDVIPIIGGAYSPAWSPDGKHLAFIRSQLGEPLAIVISDPAGGDQRVLSTADATYPFLEDPAWSPDSKTIAFVRNTGGVAGDIWLVSLDGGKTRRLTNDPPSVHSHHPVFTYDGRGVVHSSNRGGATNLWVALLDGKAPYRITTGPGPDDAPSIARDGTIAFVSQHWRYSLFVHDLATGQNHDVMRYANYLWGPVYSPDGREIAFSRFENDGLWHVWIMNADGSNPRQLTSSANGELYPRFTPDGSAILYMNWSGQSHVWRVPRNGGPPSEITDGTHSNDSYPDLSPDGKTLAFVRSEGDRVRIYLASPEGKDPKRLLDEQSTLPRWSPDGQWILYSPERSVRGGIYIVHPNGTGKRQLYALGSWGTWFPDGKSIAFEQVNSKGNEEIYVVPAAGGEPKMISGIDYVGTNYPFDISPDGKRVITSNSVHFEDELWLLTPPTPTK